MLKKVLLILLVLLLIVVLAGYLYTFHPKFGSLPEGDALQKLSESSHFADGRFYNLEPDPQLIRQNNRGRIWGILFRRLMSGDDSFTPDALLPVVKTDLKALPPEQDQVIWLGHSSFFVQLGGKRFLIDPVLSEYASPLPWVVRAFPGTTLYGADDLPAIDYLLITHDHWDHLDYPTVMALQTKVKEVYTPLGVGNYLRQWGYAADKVHEGDWFERLLSEDGLAVHLIPARHFSGRMLTRNRTQWGGYVLETAQRRLLFSGDSGYGSHFAEIAKRFAGFDLVALDSGQYNPLWPHVHMAPEQSLQAAGELNAKRMLPAHIGRFVLSNHAWNEPWQRLERAAQNSRISVATPKIGEPLLLDEPEQTFSRWW